MLTLVRLALALDLVAILCEHMFPGCRGLLPLGGDDFSQLAALVIASIALAELRTIWLARGK